MSDNNSFNALDSVFMAKALRLAERGLYTTDPNPRVGCVLVRDGIIIGDGWHKKAGEPHAERNALAEVKGSAHGATAYVTLEPCSHFGRTPPCSAGLIEAEVTRVVVAMKDPNPQVAGKGIAMLRQAGIQVDVGLMADEAAALNPGFIKRMTTGLPFVRCKLAMSTDGRTAMASGESKWITGIDARRDVHHLRARSSVVLTGIDSVIADNPSMNVRLPLSELDGVESDVYLRQPIRAVVDSQLRMPLDAQILTLPGRTLVFTRDDVKADHVEALAKTGAEIKLVASDTAGRLDLNSVLAELAAEGCNEVLIEAGATLAGAALNTGIIDELIVYQAPHLMGDAARGLLVMPGMEKMSQRVQMKYADIRQIGEDLRITLVKKAS